MCRSELTVIEAVQILSISGRQYYQVKARLGKVEGKGVFHRNLKTAA